MADKGNITIVGLGAMGGSYAMGLKGKGYHVAAMDRDQKAIDYGLKNGLIDEGVATGPVDSSLSAQSASGMRKVLGQADGLILGLYPDRILPWLRVYRGLFKQGVRITDMAGVKGHFVDDAQDMMPPGCEFIPSHPMAGIEKAGVWNADCRLFRQSNFLITPTTQNTKAGVGFAYRLAELLGFKTITMLSVAEHDALVGLASQMTHILAVCMMNRSVDHRMRNVAADSYRNLAKIANTNTDLWSEVFMANRPVLTRQIGEFIDCLQEFRRFLSNDDREGLKGLLQRSSAYSYNFLTGENEEEA